LIFAIAVFAATITTCSLIVSLFINVWITASKDVLGLIGLEMLAAVTAKL